jgi:nicotinamidase-related amidase
MKTALLLVDVQESFRHRPYWSDRDYAAFARSIETLQAGVRSRGGLLVRIFHVEPEGAFSKASGWVAPLECLKAAADVELEKHVHNAFTDTQLEAWLRERRVDHVIVSGIRTEQCCETTARVASDLGFKVTYVTEATLTFEMQRGGRVYAPAELKERTELVLDGRFAAVRTVEECLRELG